MAKRKKTPKKILIVEDESMLQNLYAEKFRQAGYRVITVTEAKTGLEIAKKEKPDIVLLDILLPEESGLYFLENIKKEKSGKVASAAVIVFSNFDEPKTREKAKALGAEAYLIKTNHTPQQLVKMVKGYVK